MSAPEFPTCARCGFMRFPLDLMPLLPGPKVCYCAKGVFTTGEPVVVPNPDRSPTRRESCGPMMVVADVSGGTITLEVAR